MSAERKSAQPSLRQEQDVHIAVLLVGTDSAFWGKSFDRLFDCGCLSIVARTSSLVEAISRLASSAFDIALVSSEYRDVELTVFALDARHHGFEGLILRAADVPGQVVKADQPDGRPVRIGDFFIDSLSRRLWVRGVEIPFRPLEFELMKILSSHPEELLSHRTLLESLWGRPDVPADRLRSLIRALRNRIETTEEPRYLLTERALGYRFIPSPEQSP